MRISALSSSLPLPLDESITVIADLGFTSIDVPPLKRQSAEMQLILRRGLSVGCVALEKGRDKPPEPASEDQEVRSQGIADLARGIELTRELECSICYLTPPTTRDQGTRTRWIDSVRHLADVALSSHVRLCIEHFPGRLFPTARETLQLVDDLAHDALALLVDVGHCLISDEDPARVIHQCGERLGYLHLDDNDGKDDLHWPLLTGQLERRQLDAVVQAAEECGYEQAFCLELNPQLDTPVENLRQGRELLAGA